jgi:hypothetical protein
MSSRRTEQCVYCGSQGDLTTEHGPPKLVFPPPRPNDLITVPACEACNGKGSKDAEYFRLCLSLNREGKASESVASLKPTVFKSLRRPEASGFASALISNLEKADDGFVLNVDMKRIHAVVERTVRCLYYHETGRRIPEVNEVSIVCNDFLRQFSPEKISDFQRTFVRPLTELAPTIIGGDAFAFASIHTNQEFVSIWGLLFYGYLPFVALTGNRRRKPGAASA